MEKHLEAVSVSWTHSFKIQRAAEQGLAKLRKYSIPAKLHHSYIVGTGRPYPRNREYKPWLIYLKFIVLHPCLRSHWFAATADPDDPTAQEDAIKTAEDIFKYIAETYLEAPTSSAPAVVQKPVITPVVKTPSFLASACSFQRPNNVATTLPTLKRTPQEQLADELTRYFNFEAAPNDGSNNEPSVQEILLNPLLWWKVSTLFDLCSIFLISCVQIHAAEFPILARMARDFLAIPATSVSVERVFSKSWHICNNLRSSLKEKTITMALLTKVWIRSGLFEMIPPKVLRRKHGDNGTE